MSAGTGADDNVLNYLREQFVRAHARLDRIDTMHDGIIVRFGGLERDVACLTAGFAGMQIGLDIISGRLDRLKRKLRFRWLTWWRRKG